MSSTFINAETTDHGHAPAGTGQPREKRKRNYKAGIASYQNHTLTLDCVVRDITPGGAKLKFETGTVVPDRFRLTIPMDGIKVDCEVKWRDDLEVGVAFLSDMQTDMRNYRKQSVDVGYVVPRKSRILKQST